MQFKDKAALFLATGGYVGKIPVAPGTFGSAVGLPLAWLISKAPLPWALLFVSLFTVLAILAAQRAETLLARKDPRDIVVDEIVGVVIVFVGFDLNARILIAGFILFRVLDIFKPVPIRWVDRKVSGGLGVVLDDVVAGIFTNLILRLAVLWIF